MRPVPSGQSVKVAVGLLLAAAYLPLAPLLLALGALARTLGARKPAIAAGLVLTYCLRELGGTLACGALWLGAGAGRFMHRPRMQHLHWRLMRWYVRGIAARALSLLEIDVRADCPHDAAEALNGPGPLIVFSRHAGPADTVLLIDRIFTEYGRHPRVVFKQAISFDPCIGLLARRLPQGMIDNSRREQAEAMIEWLAGDLGARDALLLFPEGGNFTPARRRSALERLRRKGSRRAVAQAEALTHVLPPRPTGVLAALRSRPDAGVVFVAHTGLGLAAYPAEIYRDMPIGRTMRTRMWHVAAEEVPGGEDEQMQWLNRWWEEIDEWVGRQHTEPAP